VARPIPDEPPLMAATLRCPDAVFDPTPILPLDREEK
jgi:hypothetical protein